MQDPEIQIDDDSPATSEEDWDGAIMKQAGTPVGKVRTRGPGKRPRKKQIALRISPEVLAFFRATGKGWQTRMDEVLQEYVKKH